MSFRLWDLSLTYPDQEYLSCEGWSSLSKHSAVKHSIWENNILTLPQQNIPHQTWQQFNCLSDFDASHWQAFKYLNLFKSISTIYDEEASRVQFIFQRIFAFSIIIIIFLSKKCVCEWISLLVSSESGVIE